MSDKVKLTLWRLLDGFICIFILAPLVVFYWRGSFQVLDVYTYPSNWAASSFISFTIGVLGTLAVNLSQDFLQKTVNGLHSKALQILCKRLYTYIFGWLIVNHWRGVWRLWDVYTGGPKSVGSGVLSFSIGCALLIMMKSFRNVVAPPLVTVSDFDDKNYFVIKTRFRTKPTNFWIYFLDNAFSVIIPGSLVVGVWRGQWAILDYLLFCGENSDGLVRSYLISGGIGFGLTVALFLLQWPASWVSSTLEKKNWHWLKLIFEDCFFYLACFAAVNIWRSVWGLCDELLLKNDYALSNWICHIIGAFGTMLLLHGNTVLVRDVQIDGEYMEGKGLWFFSKSLTLFEQRSGLFSSDREERLKTSAADLATGKVAAAKNQDYLEFSKTADIQESELMLQQKLNNHTS